MEFKKFFSEMDFFCKTNKCFKSTSWCAFLLQEVCSQTSSKNSHSSHRKENSIRNRSFPPSLSIDFPASCVESREYHDFVRSMHVFFQILMNEAKKNKCHANTSCTSTRGS